MPTETTIQSAVGRRRYQDDLSRQPFYASGDARPTWDDLSEDIRKTWFGFPVPGEPEYDAFVQEIPHG